MKTKLFSIICALLCTISAFAVEFNRVQVNVTNLGTSTSDGAYFVESAGFTSGFENGYDEVKGFVGGKTFIYGITLYGKQSAVFNSSIEGEYVGYWNNSDAAATFRISFDQFNGTIDYLLQDLSNDSLIQIDATTTYDFVVSANQEETQRFRFVKPFSGDEGDLEVCHINGNLEIRNNPYAKNIVVKNEADEVVLNKMPAATPQIISLEALEAGRYTVEFNEGAEVFVIAVKPEVVPAP